VARITSALADVAGICAAHMVRLEGAYHLWRKIPPRELSIDLDGYGKLEG
jgi:hypothetical protein